VSEVTCEVFPNCVFAAGSHSRAMQRGIMSTTTFTAEEQHAIEAKGFVLRMACLPAATLGLCCLAWSWPAETWLVRTFWTFFTAYFLFCWTSCFHETAHQTLTRWRWIDMAIGRILGTAMFVPYTVYRESHIRHHAYVNRPNDWELWPYSDPHCSRTFRRVFVFLDIWFGLSWLHSFTAASSFTGIHR
jgi:fatty acid desaturase